MARDFDKSSELKNVDRAAQESSEGMVNTHVNAPKTRYQTEQQVNNAETSTGMKVPDSNFVKKKNKTSGSQLKQEIASEVIRGAKGVGGGISDVNSPATYGLKSLKYSGDTGTILGTASDTPTMKNGVQGKTRVDKRLSDPNKDINFLANDQVINEYDNIDPLADSKDTVGYNGNPKNISARSQKKSGFTSAELLFDRSLDLIAHDEGVFVAGQTVKQSDVQDYGDYPTVYYTVDADGVYERKTDFDQIRGNYMPREIKVGFTRDKQGNTYVSSFGVEEDDISCNNESFDVVNRAGTNQKIFMNSSELARQTIDAKCGSPTQAHFNPLGRSVDQPTATVGYLQDVEQSTGATLFTAYKMANKARAYYLFRTSKDGISIKAPAIEALYGHLMNYNSDHDLLAQFEPTVDTSSQFVSTAGCAAGSAATLLAVFDSLGKYSTKADIVTQPRGLKMHLQTADNTINPFRLNSKFAAALNSVDVFSTIDRGYDPMNAICATDGVRLIYPYSWKKALAFTRSAYGADRKYTSKLFTYLYNAGNGANQYLIKVADPILNGVAYFCEIHANKLYSAIGGSGAGTVTWTIPVCHYGLHFGLWDLLLCAAAPYIVYERTNSMKDVLDYEVNFEYPFPLRTIGETNPMNAVNYRNVDSMSPLTPGQMLPSSAIRWTWPEYVRLMGTAGAMMPFYFSEDSFDSTFVSSDKPGKLIDNGSSAYTTPVIRAGVRLAYTDDFLGMDPKSSQLCYDRMVRLPAYSAANPDITQELSGVIYKYSQDSEGIPVLSGYYSLSLKLTDYYATPRQLGWFMPLLAGAATGYGDGDDDHVFKHLLNATSYTWSAGALSPSYRAVMYKGIITSTEQAPNGILQAGAVSINRAQSFAQNWYIKGSSTLYKEGDPMFDLPLSLGDMFSANGSVVANVGSFSPFIAGRWKKTSSNVVNFLKLLTPHRCLWTLVQKLPFVLNPFDQLNAGTVIDPFGYAYIFNLAGFMAADYQEEDFNRMNQVQNMGYGFLTDPFVTDSPVFKDSMRYTEV